MANIDVETNIQAPKSITINLVREDYLETSNQWRIGFEVCLSIGCAIFGSILSDLNSTDRKILPIYWVFLTVMTVGAILCLCLSGSNYKRAKEKANSQ